ncbi:hypothetical protein NYA9BBAC_01233 [Salinibacterium sp. NYA9b]
MTFLGTVGRAFPGQDRFSLNRMVVGQFDDRFLGVPGLVYK